MRQTKKKKRSRTELILYLILALTILLYALSKLVIFSLLFVVEFIALLAYSTKESIKTEGLRKTAIETIEAVALVIAIWLVLILLLGNTSPVDVVPSCSMLPVLKIGDLVILQHISNMGAFLKENNIPIVNVSQSQYASMLKNISNEYLAFYAYIGNKSRITDIVSKNESYKVGLYNTKCLQYYAYLNQGYNYYRCYVSNSTQSKNLIKYSYGIGNVSVNGTMFNIIYTRSITINNQTILENYSNPIIVYLTTPNDTFSGDIVHRVFAALKVGSTYYLLTKGDNNPALDIEFGNYPVDQNMVIGKVVGVIPWLGYLTLAFKGGIETAGCNQVIIH